MRSRMLVAAGLGAGLVTSTAFAEDGYRHGRVFFVEPGVTLQRATEVSAEEAMTNLPFLPGDRVWTDTAGRAEFQFPDGTAGAARPPQQARLLRARGRPGGAYRAPPLVGQRVPARAHPRLRALRGRDPGGHGPGARPRDAARRRRGRGDAGERLRRRGGARRRPAAGPARRGRAHVRALGRRGRGAAAVRPRRGNDDFARGTACANREERWAARSSEYLPDELDAYAGEFEATARGSTRARSATSGSRAWTSAGSPTRTATGPGRRTAGPGFPTSGGDGRLPLRSLGLSASWGWYWMPGRSWGPGWVSWAVGGGYVGWCPLGRHDRPVGPGATTAAARPAAPPPLRGRTPGASSARAISAAAISPAPRRRRPASTRARSAWRTRSRCGPPATGAGSATAARPADHQPPQTPGDFVRELGADNKTTIPAPWTRGYGPPPAGVDGARRGTPRRTEGDRRPARPGGTNAPMTGSGAAVGGRSHLAAAGPRPAPWYTPPTHLGRAQDGGTADRPDRSEGLTRRGRDGGTATATGPTPAGACTARATAPGGARIIQPRSKGSDGESSGGYRPRSGGESSGALPATQQGARAPVAIGRAAGARAPAATGLAANASAQRPPRNEGSAARRALLRRGLTRLEWRRPLRLAPPRQPGLAARALGGPRAGRS